MLETWPVVPPDVNGAGRWAAGPSAVRVRDLARRLVATGTTAHRV